MADHNIIRHDIPVRPHAGNFPGYRWHPATGEVMLVEKEEDMPEGYLNYHPHPSDGTALTAPAAQPKPAADALPLSREDIVKNLRDGGVEFKGNASTASLYTLLGESLKLALIAADIEHDASETNAATLLALFPAE